MFKHIAAVAAVLLREHLIQERNVFAYINSTDSMGFHQVLADNSDRAH